MILDYAAPDTTEGRKGQVTTEGRDMTEVQKGRDTIVVQKDPVTTEVQRGPATIAVFRTALMAACQMIGACRRRNMLLNILTIDEM